MSLIESLQYHAEAAPTTYFLHNRTVYPDEVFSADGFLPLIGRIAERRLARAFENDTLRCGFVYTQTRESLFKERFEITPFGENLYPDSVRLSTLAQVSRDVVGLGFSATLDLTPVYDFFYNLKMENRNALRDNADEVQKWPLYLPIRVS